jgi:hypothetical protein
LFLLLFGCGQGVKAEDVAAEVPVAALGVLHFMETVLSKMEFYRSTSSLAAIPVFLKFLNQIAVQHSQMVNQMCFIQTYDEYMMP